MTDRPRPRVADAIRRFGRSLSGRESSRARAVLHRIRDCRTAALGGHVWRCASCDRERIAYNSCRDRHCPQCQVHESHAWLEQRLTEVLPVPHFHVVFTLPEALRSIALGNPRAMYTLLFSTAAETLRVIGRDPKHLGANLGFFGILHTWGQNLDYHPHVHFVVPGGGLAEDGRSWVPSRPRFLLSGRVLARLFRRLLLEGIDRLRAERSIALPPELRNPYRWRRLLRDLRRKRWVVHLREPFATPDRVLEYLARYTHRVAIADGRIRAVDDDGVAFRFKDYRTGRHGVMRLSGEEFVRRFAMHVLPKRFVRLRYYGFMAHRNRTANLDRCRKLIELGGHAVATVRDAPRREDRAESAIGDVDDAEDPFAPRCPSCKQAMARVRELGPGEVYPPEIVAPPAGRGPPRTT